MASYIWHNDKWMEKDVVLAIRAQQPSNRAHDIPMPAIMSDIEPYQSMATGEWISSRSQHRDHLRVNNLIELGNERIKPKESSIKKDDIAKDIKTAIEQIEAGYVPPPEKLEEGDELPQVENIDVSEIKEDGQYIRGKESSAPAFALKTE